MRAPLPLAACLAAALAAAPAFAESPASDLLLPASPPKPAPPGLKFIDQGTFDPRLKGYITPEGFRLEIVAREPIVTNPVGMSFAPDGTLFVLEWLPDGTDGRWVETPEVFTYLDGSKRTVATMKKKKPDVVKVLRDTDGDGVYDRFEVVLEDELPSSILIHDGWMYLSGRGSVRRFRQSKPGGPWDIKQNVAIGFCGFHHHQVSGLTIGNDGWLYITSGDDDNVVEGSDGSRAVAFRTGAVFRCRPDGSQMHVYSLGYRNPYRDLAYDDRGNWFHVDNDNEDGSKFTGCRLMHVAEESDFGWRLLTGARCCKPDKVRGSVAGELPGTLPPMLKTGRGSPAGLVIYNDTQLPERYRGLLYYPDAFRKLVRAYKVKPDGATFEVAEEFEFLKSPDPLFRPCQMVTSPDGALYVCDWRTDSGGAGKLFGDGQHGMIFRLRWAGTDSEPAIPLRPADSWAGLRSASADQLFAALGDANMTVRQHAQLEIAQRADAGLRDRLLADLADDTKPLPRRVAVLGAAVRLWNEAVRSAMIDHLHDGSADIRRLAADALALNCKPGDAEAQEAIVRRLNDPDPAVRRQFALAIGRINAAGACDVLVNAWKADDGKDAYLTDAILRAIERTGKPGVQALADLTLSGADKERAKGVKAFTMLRTRPGAELVPGLWTDPHLTVFERAALVRSLANYLLDPPVSVEPVIEYLAKHPGEPAEVKLAAVDVIAAGGQITNPKAVGLLLPMLDDASPELRLAVIKTIESAKLTAAAPALVGVFKDARRPAAERAAVAKAMQVLNDKSAVPSLLELLRGKKPADADSLSVYADALRCLAILDPSQAQPLLESLLAEKNVALVSEAVQLLGARPEGARLVGEQFKAHKLPQELLPQVSEALRKHAPKDPASATLLADIMKGSLALSIDPKQVEKLKELVTTKGDPIRGRAVYLNSKAVACISCHKMEGVGGQIGPDLTRMWETLSLEKVLESIVEPNKEIKEGYQTFLATTKKGMVFTGLKTADTAQEVVLRDANGKDIRLMREEIDELVPSKQSLMPESVAASLSYDQFIDLLAFLKNRSAQETLPGLVLDYQVVGPFATDIQTAYIPEDRPDTNATYAAGTPDQVRRFHYMPANPDGQLDLTPLSGKNRQAYYALSHVYSPKPQKVSLFVGAKDLVKVWVNGKLLLEHNLPRETFKPDEDRLEVDLQPGWNSVLAKVINRTDGQGLYLRFAGGVGLRTAARPDGPAVGPAIGGGK